MYKFTLLLVGLIQAAVGVRIQVWEDPDCRGRVSECRTNNEWQCCDVTRWQGNNRYPWLSSSLITGLPPTAIGTVCTWRHGNDCGSVTSAGGGLNLCLNRRLGTGSYWFDAAGLVSSTNSAKTNLALTKMLGPHFEKGSNKRDVASNDPWVFNATMEELEIISELRLNATLGMNSTLLFVPADVIGFNGHRFNVGPGVSEDIIERFVTVFQNLTLYEDLPPELLIWELGNE